jgi:hypothetical protein
MNKKKYLAGVCSLLFIAGAIGFSQGLRPSGSPQNPSARPLRKVDAAIPEHVFYEQVFNSIRTLKNAEDYREEAGLADAELQYLASIAEECAGDLAVQDEKAMAIIRAFRSQTKKLKPGDPLPTPPAELRAMQIERDAIVLRHRDRLHTLLGDTRFSQLKAAAQRIVQIELRSLPSIGS